MPQRAHQARSNGFDGLFIAETTQDPFLALAAAASSANGALDLGTSIALAFPRSPMVTAVAAWQLQGASAGRLVLGLGSQIRKHIEQRFSAPFAPPAARLREYVLALNHIWEAIDGQHRCNFQGEFYRFDFLPDAVKPRATGHGPPEVYLAAFGPTMYQTAAAVANGAFVHPVHTLTYLREVAEPAIAEGLRERHRTRSQFSLSVTVLPIVGTGDDARAARDNARHQLAFYCSTPNYRPVLELHGWKSIGDELHALIRSGEHDRAASVVPDDMLEKFCVTGDTWLEAAQTAQERYAGVADRLSFYFPPPLD